MFAFIGLVWLREQILHGGGPDWIDEANVNEDIPRAAPPQADNLQEPRPQEEDLNVNNNDANVMDANLLFPQGDEEHAPMADPLPQEPPLHNPMNNAEPPIRDNEEPDNVNNDEGNEGIWNPMEFNNGAELELTWERYESCRFIFND